MSTERTMQPAELQNVEDIRPQKDKRLAMPSPPPPPPLFPPTVSCVANIVTTNFVNTPTCARVSTWPTSSCATPSLLCHRRPPLISLRHRPFRLHTFSGPLHAASTNLEVPTTPPPPSPTKRTTSGSHLARQRGAQALLLAAAVKSLVGESADGKEDTDEQEVEVAGETEEEETEEKEGGVETRDAEVAGTRDAGLAGTSDIGEAQDSGSEVLEADDGEMRE
ncbi:hypothetical protein EIP91_011284, partial [Steccherinum ochraceum]